MANIRQGQWCIDVAAQGDPAKLELFLGSVCSQCDPRKTEHLQECALLKIFMSRVKYVFKFVNGVYLTTRSKLKDVERHFRNSNILLLAFSLPL